ncbi:MAG: hypothetical protein WCP28_09055 [Actinomycetes bacterium]
MSNQPSSTYKVGLVIGLIAWAVLAILSLAGPLGTDLWAMYVGIVIGVLGVPYGIWVAKQDASHH